MLELLERLLRESRRSSYTRRADYILITSTSISTRGFWLTDRYEFIELR